MVDSDRYTYNTDEDNEESLFNDEENEVEEPMIDDTKLNSKPNYKVLAEADIREQMEKLISQVTDVLCISRIESSLVLNYYKWSANELNDAWFVDESLVRKKVGLLINSSDSVSSVRELTCGICLDSYNVKNLSWTSYCGLLINSSDSVSSVRELTCGICLDSYNVKNFSWTSYCDHAFCNDCFTSYIKTGISDGPGCLMLRCPGISCNAAIDQGLIDKLASEENKNKYFRYLVRSYVEKNKKIKWCPAPDCEYAIEVDVALAAGEGYNVVCDCNHSFCWNCGEDAHRPATCEHVMNWNLLTKSNGLSVNWILVNTKPCPNPNCSHAIEKNGGCMRMICRSCKYEFCWICLKKWNGHGYGGPCNVYRAEENYNVSGEVKHKSYNLYRYGHYYQRWIANDASFKKALADLGKVASEHIHDLSISQDMPETKLEFISDTWKQIIECRRMLKWSYVYGYYLPAEEAVKRQLFEYSQGHAEAALERLHHCAEEEIKEFLDATWASPKFRNYCIKLTQLTNVTKTFFQNLATALENGLSDVKSSSAHIA